MRDLVRSLVLEMVRLRRMTAAFEVESEGGRGLRGERGGRLGSPGASVAAGHRSTRLCATDVEVAECESLEEERVWFVE